MSKQSLSIIITLSLSIFIFSKCDQSKSSESGNKKDSTLVSNTQNYRGYESQVKWGEHLVTIGGCNDCHTPKKMGAAGPEPDLSLTLSGHPSQMPAPDIDRKELESKGLFASNDLTAWVGPWGISYAANLTSDSTGIGNWKEDQFIYCLRNGKWMGLPDGRNLLPPMPWQGIGQMNDDELKAVFAYLKSIKPIHNIVPMPQPPVLAMKK
jgi:mono/diheme cytochrome c family protein